MRQIRKILRDKRGEGYIDVAVMVLCVMLVIALGVRLFPIFITKMQVDNFADELVREAEISGRVGSETSNRRESWRKEQESTRLCSGSRTGNLQLNEEVTVTVTIQKDLGLFGNFGSFPITIRQEPPERVRCTGNEEVKKKDSRPIKRPERKYDATCGGRNHLHADYYPWSCRIHAPCDYRCRY